MHLLPIILTSLLTLHTITTTAFKTCTLPTKNTDPFETATPEEVGLSTAEINESPAYANTHRHASIQIFRNNCLIRKGLLDPVTDNLPFHIFSITKSVVSILAGIAVFDGKLNLSSPISEYLPDGPGWGDEAPQSNNRPRHLDRNSRERSGPGRASNRGNRRKQYPRIPRAETPP
ncbi:beta-lactamase/transpeptidase-like protein [Penicillium argentinense]|uniref:Beta-lactamase/transpeptidase-like protein n=1 Tax=Penicillium argentinense TaxID=1131581 RepID=A0A9W9G531_9EURO|nr:beta-lactamase/transpeptidase-like protein [Penicillium argentinense]KAJ5112174.1 beta-lactamase/transpeptidase-like protein [Penicillium argentinense]